MTESPASNIFTSRNEPRRPINQYLRTKGKLRLSAASAILICLVVHACAPLIIGKLRLSQQQQIVHHFTFKWAGGGRTMKKGAIEVSFGRFRAEDGILVERFVESYSTEREALAELQELSRRASKVITTGYKSDASDKSVGTRVELLSKRTTGKSELTTIAWTHGPKVFLLRSESRVHVLDFEQQEYPQAMQPQP